MQLLARWTWRVLLAANQYEERTLLRQSIAGIAASDEERSIQHLLNAAPHAETAEYRLPLRFDARAADSRIALLAMYSLNPSDSNGRSLSVGELIESAGVNAFRQIIARRGKDFASPANRILLPGSGAAKKEVLLTGRFNEAWLSSHGIGPLAFQRLASNDDQGFLQHRSDCLVAAVRTMSAKRAAWGRTDRPSIRYLLETGETDDAHG
jgi:hypothetical protein